MDKKIISKKLDQKLDKPKRKNKPGQGRKPKAATILKRKLQTDRAQCAEDAFDLLYTFMRDEALDPALRRQCANDILDRVIGKPKQSVDVSTQKRVLVLDLD